MSKRELELMTEAVSKLLTDSLKSPFDTETLKKIQDLAQILMNLERSGEK